MSLTFKAQGCYCTKEPNFMIHLWFMKCYHFCFTRFTVHILGFSYILNSQKRDSKIPNETETDEVGEDGDEVVEYPTDPDSRGQTFLFQREMQDLLASLSPKESTCSSRRSSIKDDDSLFAHLTSKRKGKHVRIPFFFVKFGGRP